MSARPPRVLRGRHVHVNLTSAHAVELCAWLLPVHPAARRVLLDVADRMHERRRVRRAV